MVSDSSRWMWSSFCTSRVSTVRSTFPNPLVNGYELKTTCKYSRNVNSRNTAALNDSGIGLTYMKYRSFVNQLMEDYYLNHM